jgi:hypothetical protein
MTNQSKEVNRLVGRYIAKTLDDLGDIPPVFSKSIKQHYRWLEQDIVANVLNLNAGIQDDEQNHNR